MFSMTAARAQGPPPGGARGIIRKSTEGAALEILAELFFGLVFELAADGFARGAGRTATRGVTVVGLVAALLVGAVTGLASLAILPQPLITRRALHVAFVVMAPPIVGGIMAGIGRRRARRGLSRTTLEHFPGGTSFALGFAGVRFVGALILAGG